MAWTCAVHSVSGPKAVPPDPAVWEHSNICSCTSEEEFLPYSHCIGPLYNRALYKIQGRWPRACVLCITLQFFWKRKSWEPEDSIFKRSLFTIELGLSKENSRAALSVRRTEHTSTSVAPDVLSKVQPGSQLFWKSNMQTTQEASCRGWSRIRDLFPGFSAPRWTFLFTQEQHAMFIQVQV